MEQDKIKQFSDLLSIYCDKKTILSFIEKIDGCPFSGFVTNANDKIEKAFSQDSHIYQSKLDKNFYYFDKEDVEEEKLGNSLYHHLGFFYIMDSASAYMTERLSALIRQNGLVLDMCAAPGGKTISLKLRRDDLDMIACDIAIDRAKELNRNIERMGMDIKTICIDPVRLALHDIFDAIILDAPCSGSGMIRKERKMAEDWSSQKVLRLLPIQKALLEKAYALLAPGGILAYSTCSLSYEEDDAQVHAFLSAHPDMEEILVDVADSVVKKDHGYHLIPGVFPGEGIYFAFLRKKGTTREPLKPARLKEKSPVDGYILFPYKGNAYLTRRMPSLLASLDYLRPGIRLYDASEHPKFRYDNGYSKVATGFPFLDLSRQEAIRYFAGEEIRIGSPEKDGIYILRFDERPIGFSKKVGNRLKNYLPKGLRASLW